MNDVLFWGQLGAVLLAWGLVALVVKLRGESDA